MKIKTIAIVAFVLFISQIKVLGQTLSLTGSGGSVTKGTINTEVLTAIIQQKQEELRQRVFKDIVVANFENADEAVKNFTTWYYMYNVMKVITTEKNKTIITQNLMQHTAEFALVYGFTAYSIGVGINMYSDRSIFFHELNNLFPVQATPKENKKMWNNKQVAPITVLDIQDVKSTISNDGNSISEPDLFKGKIFNFIIDMTFDALINNQSIKDSKLFKDKFEIGNDLSIWYNSDNEYQKIIQSGGSDSASAQILHDELDKIINGFLGSLDNYYKFDEFVRNLKAKEQGLTEMTQEQYLAMRSLLKEAIEIIRLNYKNSVVSKITDFVLEYTLIEYNQNDSSKASLSVDIESLISALDQHYNSKSRKSSVASGAFFINPRPFFSIGTNYASFVNENSLSNNDEGNSTNLKNMYFASEKIGIKIKFFDKKYSRSFSPGEKFKYKGSERVWLRPQKQATISDVHLIVYGSGFLYNIIDLKSNENFNYAIAGSSLGLTFFNGLSANFGLACPFTDNKFNSDNVFFNVGFDIPIIDYIGALLDKN